MSDPHVSPAENQPTADRQVDRSVTGSLKEYLGALGADLIGIGSVERLRGAPEIMQPTRYLRDGASLIWLSKSSPERSIRRYRLAARECIHSVLYLLNPNWTPLTTAVCHEQPLSRSTDF
jgi:hypothetical protein